ncbi:hypothetical protein EON76_04180 [bacterium]|nr:MAG: hypothetical protein EON76_04180 [bacterium]
MDKDDSFIHYLAELGGGDKELWRKEWQRYESRSKYPPWMDRKHKEHLIISMIPGFMKDAGILYLCTSISVVMLKDTIINYFVDHYDISPELAETFVAAAATGDDTYFNPSWQFDGVNLPGNKRIEQIDDSIAYKGAPHINIRLGRSATKEDALWVINKIWKTKIAPVTQAYSSKNRLKPTKYRDSIYYALHMAKFSVEEIQMFISANFNESVDQTTIRKKLKEYAPNNSQFKGVYNMTVDKLNDDVKKSVRAYTLMYTKDPKPHFYLK